MLDNTYTSINDKQTSHEKTEDKWGLKYIESSIIDTHLYGKSSITLYFRNVWTCVLAYICTSIQQFMEALKRVMKYCSNWIISHSPEKLTFRSINTCTYVGQKSKRTRLSDSHRLHTVYQHNNDSNRNQNTRKKEKNEKNNII